MSGVNINLTTGIFPTTQRPLDAKLYFKTLAELADLGTGNHKAFYYYDRMRVLCLEDDKVYVWREEKILNEPNGVIAGGFTYPANTVNNDIDYSDKTFNFFLLESQNTPSVPIIENIGAVWTGTGLVFNCYADPYVIANQVYSTSPGQVTLNAAPTTPNYKRKDAIVVDVNGNYSVIQGTESIAPEDPDYNEQTQRLITVVLLSANVNVPDGQSTVLIYDENTGEPTEWTVTDTGNGTIVHNSTANPNSNSVHIQGDKVADETVLSFKDDVINSTINLTALSFALETPSDNLLLKIAFLKNGAEVSSPFYLLPGTFAYQGAQNGYQNIDVPINQGYFGFSGDEFDEIIFSFKNNDNPGSEIGLFRIDSVQLVYGGDAFESGNNTYLGLDDTFDTTYSGKAKYAPVVVDQETGLKLERIPLFTDLYTGNSIINGGVDFIAGLERRVWATAFIIDQEVYFESVEGNVTHDAADTEPRWDIYYLEKLTPTSPATVGIIKGIPNANPEKPGLTDPVKQVKVGEKLFLANEPATPPEVVETLIYNENAGQPSEFDTSSNQATVFNASGGIGPYNGTVFADVPAANQVLFSSINVVFNHNNLFDFNNTGVLTFALKINASLSRDARILIAFQNTNDLQLQVPVAFNPNSFGQFGFDNTRINEWQLISIPSSVFTNAPSQFDQLYFQFTETPALSLDYVRYVTGLVTEPTETNVTDVSVQDETAAEQFRMTDRVQFQGVGFDAINKRIIVTPPTGLEAIDEGNGIGWRLIGRDPNDYGNIGLNAVDFSYDGDGTSGPQAAGSACFGSNTKSTGNGQAALVGGVNVSNQSANGVVWGYIITSGGFATSVFGAHHTEVGGNNGYNLLGGYQHYGHGFHNGYFGSNLNSDQRRTVGTIFLGVANADIGQDFTNNQAEQPLVVIGNGTAALAYPHNLLSKSNLLLARRNGQFEVPSTTIATIDAGADKVLVTKEWANSKFVSSGVGQGTGTVLNLSNTLSTLYNMGSGDTHNAISYTFTNAVLGGRAMAWINAPSKPIVNGANEEGGFPFVANADMYLVVWSPDGTNVKYYFTPKEKLEFINPQSSWSDNLNRNLVQSDNGYLIIIDNTVDRIFYINDTLINSGSVEFLNIGTSKVTFVDGTGVCSKPDGDELYPGGACTLIKIGNNNQYYLKGELE